jgi:hypothetical protein
LSAHVSERIAGGKTIPIPIRDIGGQRGEQSNERNESNAAGEARNSGQGHKIDSEGGFQEFDQIRPSGRTTWARDIQKYMALPAASAATEIRVVVIKF